VYAPLLMQFWIVARHNGRSHILSVLFVISRVRLLDRSRKELGSDKRSRRQHNSLRRCSPRLGRWAEGTREYSRLFGAPPLRDVEQIRQQP
jgi:hypothetical protein